MAIKIYGKLKAQGLDDEGKPILADAKEIALEPGYGIPSDKNTVQKAIENLYNKELPTVDSAVTIYNMQDHNYYKIWVGTQEDFANVVMQSDVIYFIGETNGDTPPPTPSNYCSVTYQYNPAGIATSSNTATSVLLGSTYEAQLYPASGGILDVVTIFMEDGEGNVGNFTDSYNQYTNTIHIDNVTGNITIIINGTIPLTKIEVSYVPSPTPSNRYKFQAILTPRNTTNSGLQWYIPQASENEFTIVSMEEDIMILEATDDADDSSVTVRCYYPPNPDLEVVPYTLEHITYIQETPPVDPGPNPNAVMAFDDQLVEGAICALIGKSSITYGEAETHFDATKDAEVFKDVAQSITTFNEWQWFKKAAFKVTNCVNLTEVTLPKIDDVAYFDSRFGIANTGIEEIVVPDGYTYYGRAQGNAEYTGQPVRGSSIRKITLCKDIAEIQKKFTNSSGDLPNLEEIDMSLCNIVNIANGSSYLCTSLPNLRVVKLPDILETISGYCFKNCTNLKRVEFGENFTSTGTTGIFADTSNSIVSNDYTVLVFKGSQPPSQFALKKAGGNPSYQRKFKILAYAEYLSDYEAAFANFTEGTNIECIFDTIENETD